MPCTRIVASGLVGYVSAEDLAQGRRTTISILGAQRSALSPDPLCPFLGQYWRLLQVLARLLEMSRHPLLGIVYRFFSAVPTFWRGTNSFDICFVLETLQIFPRACL